jgi:hypothetical protein
VKESEISKFHYSSYESGEKWIYWGMILDDKVAKVLLDGEEIDLIDTAYGFKLCFLDGIRSEIEQDFNPICELIY